MSELDQILSDWHEWAQAYKPARGFKNRALVVGDYLISRQYDSDNGALDQELDNKTMETVDFQISELQEPYRSAIHCEAKNIHAGNEVFISPRLPTAKGERDAVIGVARRMLVGRLQSAGVL